MNLPYAFRLLCLIAVAIGAIHLVLQFVLAAGARPILRLLRPLSVRQRECALYLLQIGPLLAAILFAGALCVPQYLRYEPNDPSETVSLLCLLSASAACLWFALSILSGLRLTLRTLRFSRACARAGTVSAYGRSPIPVLTLPGSASIFALVGFIHPVIFVSRSFTEGGALAPAALDIALDHERAHAARLDNWKRLSLSFVPRLPFGAIGDLWMRHWQEAVEWAADDEAVAGDPARSLLLAETLLAVARSAPGTRPPVICTAFYCANAGLGPRIERLVHDGGEFRGTPRSLLLFLSAMAIAAVAAAAAVSPWIYGLSEHVLHLR